MNLRKMITLAELACSSPSLCTLSTYMVCITIVYDCLTSFDEFIGPLSGMAKQGSPFQLLSKQFQSVFSMTRHI